MVQTQVCINLSIMGIKFSSEATGTAIPTFTSTSSPELDEALERFRNELTSFVNDNMRNFTGERRRNRPGDDADGAGPRRRWTDAERRAQS